MTDIIEQEQYTPADMADQGAQGWRDGYAWAKGECCPEGYVMVPVDPTAEMLDVLYANMGGSEADGALISGYKNLLAAAPQAEQVVEPSPALGAELEQPQYTAADMASQAAQGFRDGQAADKARIESLQAECEKLRKDAEATRKSVKLLNYLFARNIIAMQSAVIEWEKGKGAAAGMQWIWNTLFGPGQIPDEDETDAQAYFDREIEPLDAAMQETSHDE